MLQRGVYCLHHGLLGLYGFLSIRIALYARDVGKIDLFNAVASIQRYQCYLVFPVFRNRTYQEKGIGS